MRSGLRRSELAALAVCLAVSAATLLAAYAHTERTLQASPNCPACHFQGSSVATTTTPCLFLPRITFLKLIKIPDIPGYGYLAVLDRLSRAPPLS